MRAESTPRHQARLAPWALVVALLFTAAPSAAKRYGGASPGGRPIYKPEQTFEGATLRDRRHLVLETAVGMGPEGTLGVLAGVINAPIRGLEYYLGFGVEANPARQYSLSVRYAANVFGFRPYATLGYLVKDLPVLVTHTHNLFGEVGYRWVLHDTYFLALGVGVRLILSTHVRDGSPLLTPDADPALLEQEISNMSRWVPTGALRFGRSF